MKQNLSDYVAQARGAARETFLHHMDLLGDLGAKLGSGPIVLQQQADLSPNLDGPRPPAGGTAGNDTLSGTSASDTMAGGAGSDTINGLGGDDTLYSDAAGAMDHGTEVDTLSGGDGSDTIYAGYGDNVDGGTNGNYGDQLYISFQGATSGISFDAHLATQTIGGGTITGIENYAQIEGSNYGDYIDASGAGNGYSLTQLYGMGGNDTLIAGYYTSFMDGGDGNDIVDGRGSQYMSEVDGGAGDDTIYAPTNSLAAANGGDGNDIIYSNFQAHGGAGDDAIHLSFGYYGTTATGDAGNDTISGSEAAENIQGNDGDDALDGAAGDDVLSGGTGTDLITGGAGADRFIYAAGDGDDTITDLQAGEIVEIDGYGGAQAITQVGSDVVMTLSNTDQIIFQNTDVATVSGAVQFGPPTDDTIVGTSGDDTLHGYGGNDTISGNAGNDALYGDDGYDTIAGGSGADMIDGGTGDDTLYSSDISPEFSFPYYGNPYVPPILDVGTEVDTLKGGAGDDTLFAGYGDNVDGGADAYYGDKLFISFQGATSGITFDAHLATQTIGGGTITGIENISWVQGSNYDDYIDVGTNYGNGYSDRTTVFGMGGNDTLIAGYYTQLMDGGDGNDIVDGRGSQYMSEVDGGAGDDTIYAPTNGLASANGGDGNDIIYSNYQAHGGAGNDTIYMSFGYYGLAATGDAGDDTIIGSSAAETFSGGTGNDTLTGGGGNDTFLYRSGDRADIITDFTSGDVVTLTGYSSAQSITQSGSNVIVVLGSGDQITFQNTTVSVVQAGLHFDVQAPLTLNGTAGNDTLTGGTGNDTLNGALSHAA